MDTSEVKDLQARCRGPPQELRLLEVMMSSLIEVSGRSASEVLAPLCRLLALGEEEEVDDNEDGMNTKLSLPLSASSASPSSDGTTASWVDQLAKAASQSTTVWMDQLVIPLLQRWRLEERQRLVQAHERIQSNGGVVPQALRTFSPGGMPHLQWAAADHLVMAARRGETARDMNDVFSQLSAATGSFRVVSVGSVALLQAQWLKLLEDIRSASHNENEAGNDLAMSRARLRASLLAHKHADALLGNLIQFFSRNSGSMLYAAEEESESIASEAMLSEAQWLFIMCVVQSAHESAKTCITTSGDDVQLAVAAESLVSFCSHLRQRLLRYAQIHLTNTQSGSNLSENVLVTRDVLWNALSEADNTSPDTDVDIRQQLGQLFATVERLTTVQAAPDEEAEVATALSSNGGGDSDSFSSVLEAMRRTHKLCVTRYRQAEAASYVACSSSGGVDSLGHKRPRERSGYDNLTSSPPQNALDRYMATVFYTVYHPSCFAFMRPERQRLLSRGIRELVTVLDTLRRSATQTQHQEEPLTGDSGNHANNNDDSKNSKDNAEEKEGDEEEDWKSEDEDAVLLALTHDPADTTPQETSSAKNVLLHHRVKALLAADARLSMLLCHSVLMMLSRRGKISAEDTEVLSAHLIPALVSIGNANDNNDDVDGSGQGTWTVSQRAIFCVHMLVNAEILLALPWSVGGLYLALTRYNHLSQSLLHRHNGDPVPVLEQLVAWTQEGGGGAARATGTSIADACDAIDEAVRQHDVLYHDIAVGEMPSDDVLDNALRGLTPLRVPAPCGTLLVVSFYRTITRAFYRLRNAWEEQQQLAMGDDAIDYLGRTGAFCTSLDVRVFTMMVQTAHRMIFGFQAQPAGLLRLWVGYLHHVFSSFVPPPSDGEEALELMPNSWQLRTVVNCFGETVERRGWRALCPQSRTTSSQTDLRMALGVLLADLALMPCIDPMASTECPSAFPAWQHPVGHQNAGDELREAQRALPHAVLEEVCFFVGIDTERELPSCVVGSPVGDGTAAQGAVAANSFLGLPGLVTMCQRIDSVLGPGSVKDERLAFLIRCLWAAADIQALNT